MAAFPDTWLEEGIAASRAGQDERARALLLRVVQAGEQNVRAWYWLSRVIESPEEREICLENVLVLDPAHTGVQAELAALRRDMASARAQSLPSKDAIAASIPRTADEQLISDACIEPPICPYCGGVTAATDRQCPNCHRDLQTRKPKAKDHSVYSLGLVVLWFGLANYLWLGMAGYYLFSDLSAAADASPQVVITLQTLGNLMGRQGSPAPDLDVPLTPVLLAGGAAFLFSLVVAWGLYRRLRFFYWLTVGLLFLGFMMPVYQAAKAETMPLILLATEVGTLVVALSFAFMAYDEFAWVEERITGSVDRDVGNGSSLYARGREYARCGMWARAAAHWSRAVALSPGQPDYRLALASAYVHLGQPERAREHLDEAGRIEPNHPQIRELLEALNY